MIINHEPSMCPCTSKNISNRLDNDFLYSWSYNDASVTVNSIVHTYVPHDSSYQSNVMKRIVTIVIVISYDFYEHLFDTVCILPDRVQ